MTKAVPKTVGALTDKQYYQILEKNKKLWEILKKADLRKCIELAEFDYPTSVLIWQYIRCNPDYREDFETRGSFKIDKNWKIYLQAKWGLNDFYNPATEIHPAHLRFEFVPAVSLPVFHSSKRKDVVKLPTKLLDIYKPHGNVALVYVMRGARKTDVRRAVEDIFTALHSSSSKKKLSYNVSTVKTIIMCHLICHFKQLYRIRKIDLADIMMEIDSDFSRFSDERIREYSNKFLEISNNAPHIFFKI